MRVKDHQLPETGPGSNPVLYGVAHGLCEMFPPVQRPSFRDETDDQVKEDATLADEHSEVV